MSSVWEQMPQGTHVCGFQHVGKVGKGQIPLPGASLWDREQKAGDFFFFNYLFGCAGS